MHISPRSYLTSGIAALGVGAIALAPIQPIPSQLALAPQRVVSDLGVELATAVDPITAWVDTFETTFANIGILGEFYMQNPFPLLQTIAANTATYAEEAANGQGDLILGQIWENIQTFFQAPWSPGATAELGPPLELPDGGVAEVPVGTYLSGTEPLRPVPDQSITPPSNPQSPANLNLLALQFVAGLSITANPEDGTDKLWEQIVSFSPIWRFLNTPYSGQVLGLLGPVLSPIVALGNSFNAIVQDLSRRPNPDLQSALFELINIPANMTNAFFNGAGFWDLTDLVKNFIDLPEDFAGVKIGLNMGGLLNAVPVDGSLNDPDNPPTEWASGVGFDSLAVPYCVGDSIGCDFVNAQPIPGLPNSWIGNSIGLGQFLAEQLLVTPPPPNPPAAAVEPAAAKSAAPVEIAPPALTEEAAPAVADAPADEAEPVAVEVEEAAVAVEVEAPAVVEPAPADVDVAEVEAAVEAAEVSAAEPAEADAPAAPESTPEAAAGGDDQSDTGRADSQSRRGAR